jgi:hypothetical protein
MAVPVRGFRVRHLMAMEPGQLIETHGLNTEWLPMRTRVCTFAEESAASA